MGLPYPPRREVNRLRELAGVMKVAVIGSGPTGFYAAEELLKKDYAVDMLDRLPAPYGLVRYGVAPDHQKIKSVINIYEKVADNPKFRFFGNVELGRDVSIEELRERYTAVLLCTGAQSDRRMGIPGEDLPGSHPATEFVAWYNGHPDFCHLKFDLSQERVAVVGVGNVAVDVARILCRTPEELEKTDIADYALEALRHSRVKEVWMLGRRGAEQAAFTNPELRELTALEGADLILRPDEIQGSSTDKLIGKRFEILQTAPPPRGMPRKLHLRFLVSPVEITGEGRVQGMRLVRNRLNEAQQAEPTGEFEDLDVGLVFRSVGYRGVPLQGVPFDSRKYVISNHAGRVVDESGAVVPRLYTAGWIKRGPSGVIGTNKPCAKESVEKIIEDGLTPPGSQDLTDLLVSRGVRWVTFDDWKALDKLEVSRGGGTRPRVKFTALDEMIEALGVRA